MRTIPFVLFLLQCIGYASCGCTKKKCGDPGIELKFNGFALSEIDTIYQIVNNDTAQYQPGISSDSAYTYVVRTSGGLYINEITLWIPGADNTYSFSSFEYEKKNCNQCFPFGHDKYDAYKECVMNGVRYTGTVIELYK